MYADELHENVTQGDILSRFGTKILPKINPKELGFMVLTYTCDLVNKKELAFINICPVFSINVIIDNFIKLNLDKSEKKLKNELIQRILDLSKFKKKYYFFLTPNPIFNNIPAYADIGQISNLPLKYYEDIKSSRLISLLSPWREKLGWKLGYLFNRIALEDVKKDEIENFIDNNEILKEFLRSK